MKLIVSVLLCLLSSVSFATPPSQEQILQFDSQILVNKDSTVNVTESIRVSALGQAIKRGLVREVPTRYQDKFGRVVDLHLRVLSVKQNGQTADYHTQNRKNGIAIYIGSSDRILSPGIYTYQIEYSVRNALGFFSDHDELYWNVTGNAWRFPILAANATLQVEGSDQFSKTAVYTGPIGSRASNATVNNQDGLIDVSTKSMLAPGEGLTIVAAWPKGIVVEPTVMSILSDDLIHDTLLLFFLMIFLAQLAYYLFAWVRVGRGPSAGTIMPLFEPPSDLSPAAMRYLSRLAYDSKTYASALLSLAAKGVLTLTQKDDDITLSKNSDSKVKLAKGEAALSKSLFKKSDRLEFTEPNHKRIRNSLQAHKIALDTEIQNSLFRNNYRWLIPGLLLTGVALFILLIQLIDGLNPTPVAIMVMAVILLTLVYDAYQRANWFSLIVMSAIVVGICALAFTLSWYDFIELTLVSGIILLNLIFQRALKAYTVAGRRLMDKVEGFALFLRKTEKYRLQQTRTIEKNLDLFQRYLPYAVALDLEASWTGYFEDEINQALAQGDTPIVWYHGASDNFSASKLSNALGTSIASVITAAAAAPGTSSGFSSGGGFSGGGGGGGGGGGW